MAIVKPPLMTERNELHATGWKDCAYASAMMAVWYARQGPQLFPLGYTAPEREALERSDSQPDETGADIRTDIREAVKNRYKKDIPLVSNLDAILPTLPAGLGFVTAGSNANLPTHYRRWDPSFAGGHSTFIITLGGGKVWWMDPEAPSTYPGEEMTIADFVKWSWGYGLQVKGGEWAPPPPPPAPTYPFGSKPFVDKVIVTAKDGLRARTEPNTKATIVKTLPFGSSVTTSLKTTSGGLYLVGIRPHRDWFGIKQSNGKYLWIAAGWTKPA